MSDAGRNFNLQIAEHHSHFKKDFQMLLAVYRGHVKYPHSAQGHNTDFFFFFFFLIQFNVPFKIISLIETSQSIGGAKREYPGKTT